MKKCRIFKEQQKEETQAVKLKKLLQIALEAKTKAEYAINSSHSMSEFQVIDQSVIAAQEYTKAADLYAKAEKEYETQECFRKAAKYWRYVCQACDERDDYHYELADVLIALDDYKEATKMFKKSAEFAKTAENKVEALEAAILCLEKQIDNRNTNK